jgi:2,5-diamino-6-(ribosylamino)-4(3H)-pyrimidinone 5'-phosphate reductase
MDDEINTPSPTESNEEQSEVGGDIPNETAMSIDTNEEEEDDAEVEAEAEREAQGEAGGAPQREETSYSLFTDVPNLGLLRQRLFEIEDTIELSPADFRVYWPYMDNVWVKSRVITEPGLTTEYFSCRLRSKKQQNAKPTPEGKQQRAKRERPDILCRMSLKIIHNEGVIRSHTIMPAAEKDVKHTHDLDYIDSIKRNRAIMDTARREAVKGFTPTSIFNKMWEEPEKMREAGGEYLKLSDVRNVQYHWRQANPDVILRTHSGSTDGKQQGPRRWRGTRKPPQAGSQPPFRQGLAPVVAPYAALPPDTLRYPGHAREFLEHYLPSIPSPASAVSSRVMPHITLTYASSLDSRISLAPGLQTALSGPESKAMTHYIRSRHDAILVGVHTVMSDDPALNCRLEGAGGYGGIGLICQPRPIIIDPHARLLIRPDMAMLRMVALSRGRAPWIIVGQNAMLHPVAVSTLKAHGGEYLMVHDDGVNAYGKPAGLNWEGIFAILFKEGIKSVMVEGGGIVLSELLKSRYASLIDSVIVTLAPTFLGKGGVQVSPDTQFDSQSGRPIASRLTQVRWQPMGAEDVIMCGKIRQEPLPPPPPTNGILTGIAEQAQMEVPSETTVRATASAAAAIAAQQENGVDRERASAALQQIRVNQNEAATLPQPQQNGVGAETQEITQPAVES